MNTAPVLLIDTSIIGVSMAIADMNISGVSQSLLWKKIHPENMGSVPAIGTMLQEGLQQCSLKFQDVQGVCVSVGPGSFTGIKVGLAFTFGLKLARKDGIPLLGVSALESAWTVLASEKKDSGLKLFLPATKTHGFMASSVDGKSGSVLFDTGSARCGDEIGTSSNDSKNLIFRGWPLLADLLTSRGKQSEIIDEISMCNAAVYGMAEVAKQSWPKGFGAENPAPRYLRLSTAEEKLIADQALSADNGR